MLATLVGGALAAGGANAINMYVDRDIDAIDGAHQGPAPGDGGHDAPGAALTFAISLEVVAFAELWALVNLLSPCWP